MALNLKVTIKMVIKVLHIDKKYTNMHLKLYFLLDFGILPHNLSWNFGDNAYNQHPSLLRGENLINMQVSN